MEKILKKIESLAFLHGKPDKKIIEEKQVKLGLRNADGTGVVAGITAKGDVTGYEKITAADGTLKKVPVPGKLIYCGYDAISLVKNYQKEERFGFEEVSYLLLTGILPSKTDLDKFSKELASKRALLKNQKTIIMGASRNNDHMAALCTAVSSLNIYDKNPNSADLKDIISQCMDITAKMPVIIANNYLAKKGKKVKNPDKKLSAAENFLYLLKGKKPGRKDALIFDSTMVLLAEHGGGNNSTFAVRVVSSSGANSYMALSSGVASLSGPLHGGASEASRLMMKKISSEISNWNDKKEIEKYLTNILNDKSSFTSGKIFGMGHAVYTVSDPRVEIMMGYAKELAVKNNKMDEFSLYKNVEEIAPKVLLKEKNIRTCANVDFYSGFVYENLGIPLELFTPVFAMSRVSGWAAHRIEEIVQGRLIRPAYISSIKEEKVYVPLNRRG